MMVAEVMVPLVICHESVVAPAGPPAVLPVELAQTCTGFGVMVGVDGLALMVTLTVFVAEQPAALVKIGSASSMDGAPAAEVMVWILVAEVMEPFTICHE